MNLQVQERLTAFTCFSSDRSPLPRRRRSPLLQLRLPVTAMSEENVKCEGVPFNPHIPRAMRARAGGTDLVSF